MSISDRLDEIESRPVAWPWLDRAADDKRVLVAALRAVLDLHKPDQYDDSYSGATGYMCEACLSDDGVTYMEYPCPTARAIADALGEEA